MRYKFYLVIFLAFLLLELGRIPFGTFGTSSVIDTISHVFMPATGGPLLLMYLVRQKFLKVRGAHSYIFLMSLVGIAGEVLWEIVEFIADHTIGTHWQISNTDTMTDIMLGVGGAMMGALVFAYVYRKDLRS